MRKHDRTWLLEILASLDAFKILGYLPRLACFTVSLLTSSCAHHVTSVMWLWVWVPLLCVTSGCAGMPLTFDGMHVLHIWCVIYLTFLTFLDHLLVQGRPVFLSSSIFDHMYLLLFCLPYCNTLCPVPTLVPSWMHYYLTNYADKAVKLTKRKASAALLPPVIMEGESLESVYQFDYLGCRFTSDGDDAADMRHRMAIAGEPSRSLNYLWSDNRLPRSLKLCLYAASVCSTLTHGSEAWMLTPRALATLNGFNSRQLHRITGRSYRDEATKPSYDLLTAVRTRRHHWLGHILRMPPTA